MARDDEPVVIARRFNGPPGSGHGGYSRGLRRRAGRRAGRRGDAAAAAAARDAAGGRRGATGASTLLRRREQVVAEARPASSRVDGARAGRARRRPRAASERFAWRHDHPFPTCFGCGPRARPGRRAVPVLRPGRRRPLRGAVDAAGVDGDGDASTPVFVWAALDCPSSAPVHGTISRAGRARAPHRGARGAGRGRRAARDPVVAGALRRAQAPHRRWRCSTTARRAPAPSAARSGSSSRGRWAHERRGPAHRRHRPGRASSSSRRWSAEVGALYGTGCRRARRAPGGAVAARRRLRRAVGGRPRGGGRRRQRLDDGTCEIKRMYVVPEARGRRARPRAARGARGARAAISATRGHGSTRAPSSRARSGSTSAPDTPPSPTTTTTRSPPTGAEKRALVPWRSAASSGARRAPRSPRRRRRGRAGSSLPRSVAGSTVSSSCPGPGEPAARQAAAPAVQVAQRPLAAVQRRRLDVDGTAAPSPTRAARPADLERDRPAGAAPSPGVQQVISGSPWSPSHSSASSGGLVLAQPERVAGVAAAARRAAGPGRRGPRRRGRRRRSRCRRAPSGQRHGRSAPRRASA